MRVFAVIFSVIDRNSIYSRGQRENLTTPYYCTQTCKFLEMLQEEMVDPPDFTYLRSVEDDVNDWEARGVKETNIREDPFIVLNQQY